MKRTREDYPARCFEELAISNLRKAFELAQGPGGEAWRDLLLVILGAQPGSSYTAYMAKKVNPELAQALLDWFVTLPEPGPHDIDLWIPESRVIVSSWLEY